VTVGAAAEAAVHALTAAGFAPADARRDVSVLARHALGWTTAEWVTNAHAPAPAGFPETLDGLVRRRLRHEPVAYITGVREFYGREFLVTPAVLIPRPETEGIVETVATGELGNWRTGELHGGRPVIVDIGTGSGCLAITLALEFPSAHVIATDISDDALRIARENARRLGASNVEFVRASLLPAQLPPVDLIVSNPPYVPERERDSLQSDVRDFEPASALFPGPDGLDVIRELVPCAAKALAPGGMLLMEIGAGQADAVTTLVAHAGLRLVAIRPDLQ
jgi:release factor glutamine methyltransferase